MLKFIIHFSIILMLLCSCSGESETALDWFNKAVKLNYSDPIKAIEYLNKAIKLQPNYADAYYHRGVAYISMGQHIYAVEDFNKVIKLQPNYANAYNNRGFAHAGLQQYQRAIDDYSNAISLKPDHVSAFLNRGTVYFKQGNNKLGCKDVKKACDLGNCDLLKMAKIKRYCY